MHLFFVDSCFELFVLLMIFVSAFHQQCIYLSASENQPTVLTTYLTLTDCWRRLVL